MDMNLTELADGAVQEKILLELAQIFENIQDPNTVAETKRTLTIKLDFKPDKNRQIINTDINLVSKLAPSAPISTTILTGKDLITGRIDAKELKSSVPGQTYIDENGEIRTDVGELVKVDGSIVKSPKIIDLQEKRG